MKSLISRLSQLFGPAGGGEFQPAPKLVLLVSGDDDLTAELVRALEQDHHHVIELEDGREVFDYLGDSRRGQIVPLPRPQVIIASLSMAGMSGLALLEELDRVANRTPFIGLAEAGDAEAFERARALGASYIFEPPLQLDDIRAALHSLPGGVFPESKSCQYARLEACERGMHFMRPAAKR
jgi:DNA-binding response OmpR family regulator